MKSLTLFLLGSILCSCGDQLTNSHDASGTIFEDLEVGTILVKGYFKTSYFKKQWNLSTSGASFKFLGTDPMTSSESVNLEFFEKSTSSEFLKTCEIENLTVESWKCSSFLSPSEFRGLFFVNGQVWSFQAFDASDGDISSAAYSIWSDIVPLSKTSISN